MKVFYRERHDDKLKPHPSERVLLRGRQKVMRSLVRVLLLIPVLAILTILKCYQLYTIWEIWEHHSKQQQQQHDYLTVGETSDKIEFVSRYTITKSGISDLSIRRRKWLDFGRRKNNNCHITEPVCGC